MGRPWEACGGGVAAADWGGQDGESFGGAAGRILRCTVGMAGTFSCWVCCLACGLAELWRLGRGRSEFEFV
jgi:hypothetical protein